MPDPKSATPEVQQAMQQALRKMDSTIPPALERLKQTARSCVDEAEQLARQARRASGTLAAVKPPPVRPASPDEQPAEQLPESITRKYNALKNFG